MKKNKGFTLVELLAVIVILGILIAFSTISISKIKKKQDQKNYENVISSILTGAKAYNAEVRKSSFTVEELIKSGYVDFDQNKYPDLKNKSVTKESCSNNLKVRYVLDGYNDCGCEEQKIETAKELCTE